MQISTQRQCQGLLQYFRTFLHHVWFLRPKFHFMAEMSPHKSVEWQSCRIPLSPETLHKWGAEGKPLHALALHGEPAGSLVGINLVWTCSNLVVCPRVLMAVRRWSKHSRVEFGHSPAGCSVLCTQSRSPSADDSSNEFSPFHGPGSVQSH